MLNLRRDNFSWSFWKFEWYMAVMESWWQLPSWGCGIQRFWNVLTNDDVASASHQCFSKISPIDDVTTDYIEPTTISASQRLHWWLLTIVVLPTAYYYRRFHWLTKVVLRRTYYCRGFSEISLIDDVTTACLLPTTTTTAGASKRSQWLEFPVGQNPIRSSSTSSVTYKPSTTCLFWQVQNKY